MALKGQAKKDYQRDLMRKRRSNKEGSNKELGTGDVRPFSKDAIALVETVPASYVEGIGGKKYEALPERARYLELSDGQVLDRLNQPTPNIRGDRAMQACNESGYNYRPNESSKERVKAMVKEAMG